MVVKIKVFVFGRRAAKQTPKRPQNKLKIDLKTAPREPKCRSEVLLDFRLNFSPDCGRFGAAGPLEIRPLSLPGSLEAVSEAKWGSRKHCDKHSFGEALRLP